LEDIQSKVANIIICTQGGWRAGVLVLMRVYGGGSLSGREDKNCSAARRVAALMVIATITIHASSANAEELDPTNRRFAFGGIDVGNASTITWIGLGGAPLSNLDEDGIRLRALGGAGYYRYRTQSVPDGKNTGVVTAGEILIGRRLTFDPTTVTASLGIDLKNYSARLPEPDNPLRGTKIGIKAALEFFTRPAPDWFVTAHGNISSVYQSYNSRIAVSRNLGRFFTLGAEGAAIGDERSHEIRAGIVGGLQLGRSIATIAVGMLQNSDKGSGTYSTVTYYAPF